MIMELSMLFLMGIAHCETRGEKDPDHAIGKDFLSFGRYQITAQYLNDVNRISGKHFTMDDCYDPVKSQEMMEIYLGYYVQRAERRTGRLLEPWEIALIHRHGPRGYERGKKDHYAVEFNSFMKKMGE